MDSHPSGTEVSGQHQYRSLQEQFLMRYFKLLQNRARILLFTELFLQFNNIFVCKVFIVRNHFIRITSYNVCYTKLLREREVFTGSFTESIIRLHRVIYFFQTA